MKVTALAASAQLGGTERVLLDFAADASDHGIHLTVLVPRTGPLLERLKTLGVPADIVPPPPALLRSSQQPGRLRWTIPALAALPVWAKALSRHTFWRNADALYTIGFKAHLATLLTRKHPVVWHLHEFPPTTTGTAWRWLARRVPDAIIANSKATARAWGNGATVIHNGVDLEGFRPRPRTGWIHHELGIHREHRLVGMPAVFARWKGQLEAIQAFSVVRDQFSDTHLVLVGGNIYHTVAEEQFAEELRHAVPLSVSPSPLPRVHMLPFQTEIERVYPELNLVLHYSLRPEPFGRVILEAMACGVPVIAADEGGPVEILGERGTGNGKGGWLVQPRDPDALATTLRQVLALPPAGLRAVGAEGRQRAVDHFSASTFAARVAEVLRRAPRPR